MFYISFLFYDLKIWKLISYIPLTSKTKGSRVLQNICGISHGDVIMMMATQIPGLPIVWSTVCACADERKFPSQRPIDAENVSI